MPVNRTNSDDKSSDENSVSESTIAVSNQTETVSSCWETFKDCDVFSFTKDCLTEYKNCKKKGDEDDEGEDDEGEDDEGEDDGEDELSTTASCW
eukprot:CAMPEP_0195510402 /NCGR_PEP_ID=MMETSP0794_2-20130614/3051_1 /TAXON_ID=515487 /ORGANISM="Stephanopyxis turris, Strain CCMP 815" /LENGTH=93 /DNA_ID=CAMNT_0040637813 /DNA_START=419 /DNA_END=697 /DNA_ORIENTATION=+